MVKKTNEAEFESVAMTGNVVVDFSATWCGPCKMLAPVLEQVSEEMTEVSFFNVDVDETPNLATKYGITNIPALLVLKDGKAKNMLVGFKPQEVLKNEIKNALNQ